MRRVSHDISSDKDSSGKTVYRKGERGRGSDLSATFVSVRLAMSFSPPPTQTRRGSRDRCRSSRKIFRKVPLRSERHVQSRDKKQRVIERGTDRHR